MLIIFLRLATRIEEFIEKPHEGKALKPWMSTFMKRNVECLRKPDYGIPQYFRICDGCEDREAPRCIQFCPNDVFEIRGGKAIVQGPITAFTVALHASKSVHERLWPFRRDRPWL